MALCCRSGCGCVVCNKANMMGALDAQAVFNHQNLKQIHTEATCSLKPRAHSPASQAAHLPTALPLPLQTHIGSVQQHLDLSHIAPQPLSSRTNGLTQRPCHHVLSHHRRCRTHGGTASATAGSAAAAGRVITAARSLPAATAAAAVQQLQLMGWQHHTITCHNVWVPEGREHTCLAQQLK